ncbi:phenolic acid decarboxylase subunit C [Andreesenia angusta]|uniref:Phenolic acid decarboxylase subunit C n=1 Tax=Andreesenia angusta TaxID=39480 RepID=A0A1S1V3V2_9FIRM|nr:UbiD family decarboxylase [Andreesenia angusta]OHW61333.1 phenolic acid decarboxylase subunit C [Andreesenia angusta]
MGAQMLRAVMDKLRRSGDLMECNTPVDAKFELGAVLRYFENEKPMIFNNVKGYDMPLIGALYGNRRIYYDLMGVNTENRLYRFMDAIANPQPYKIVSSGPIKENLISGRAVDIPKILPSPTSHEHDSGAFITAGMMIIKDDETGEYHMAVRRFQVRGGNIINTLVSRHSPRLRAQIERYAKMNKPLECAVVLGYDETFLLASQISSSRYGIDKFEVDSALRGEPLELTKCSTIDVLVPAQAEMVLEGHIVPGRYEVEGPFGELMGYYGESEPVPVMEVTAISHRNNPVFQHAFPCREEHFSNGLIREVEVFNAVNNLVECNDVNITIGGGCRLHAIVSINKKKAGDPKTAILGALSSGYDIKHVVVVDGDIDIYNTKSVELALASRVQASKDVVIIPDALGSALEASHTYRGVSDKMGIDATKPLDDEEGLYNMAIIPGYEGELDIEKYFPGIKNRK